MNEQNSSSKALIVREPHAIQPMQTTAITIWKGAKRALPVVGTAALVWAGRKAAKTLVEWGKQQKLNLPDSPTQKIKIRPAQSQQTSRQYHVRYVYTAVHWSVSMRPNTHDLEGDS